MRVLRGGSLQARCQFVIGNFGVVDEITAIGIHAQPNRFGLDKFLLVADTRQINIDGMLHDRHGDDEDDQQHQHDIDQRRHVDLVHHLVSVVLGSKGHDQLAFFITSTLAAPEPLTRAPVTK